MDTESLAITRESRLKFCNITLCLAYQSFGVVYGELSTAPIFVYKSTFSGRLRFHEEDDEIFGVLSMILWTLAIIPPCKYIIFVLGADDSGEGAIKDLWHTKVGLLGASHASYDDMPAYNSGFSSRERKGSSFPKDFFDKHRSSRILLLLVVLLSTSMVIGEGVLTPSISDYIVLVACVILVGLFALQHCGTQRVGFLFAPIVAWLLCISVVGIYNIIHWNPHVVSALSPYYIYNFFKKAGKDGWSSLGRIVLCITGVEAMFADLGHFSQLPIRIIHTSNQIHGQIYIPEVNWILMIMCLSVTIGFRDMIGNAYGLAVVTVMFITTCLMFLVIIMIWKCNVLVAAAAFLIFFWILGVALFLCLPCQNSRWGLAFTFSFLILSVMCIWHYGTLKKHSFELENKVCLNTLLSMAQNLGINRVPGIGLIYSDVYGYKDAKKDSYAFERGLMETMEEFLLRNCDDCGNSRGGGGGGMAVIWQLWRPQVDGGHVLSENAAGSSQSEVRFRGVRCSQELEKVEAAKEAGLAYMMGNTSIIASDTSSYMKKFVIDIVYAFLRRNCRRPALALGVPHTSLSTSSTRHTHILWSMEWELRSVAL
ncbi:hypothetical protein I3760_10G109800 [Carya illinoinensis]|nr:hypothetical protein I3760_10G109800 [Carya illinoinensis]